MKKLYRIILLILVFIFLSTYSPSGFNLILQKNNTFLKIQKIEIVNNSLIKDSEIKEKLSKIYNKNIFLIKRKDIEGPLKEINFLEKIEVKKKYPNTIIVKIFETKPVAILYKNKAKYSSSAKTKHIMPAQLSLKKYKEVLSLAKKAHNLLRCRGITRSDFRFFKNKFYLLEVNTQPGMTKLSLVPEIANYSGIKFEDLVVWMVKDASSNR